MSIMKMLWCVFVIGCCLSLSSKNAYIFDCTGVVEKCNGARTFNDVRCLYQVIGMKLALEKALFSVYLIGVDAKKIINPDVIIWFDACGVSSNEASSFNHAVLVNVSLEPDIVTPDNFDPLFLNHFDIVATWDDNFIDNKRFFKIHYPVAWPMIEDLVPFSQKKLCVLINKYMSKANDPHGYGTTGYGERQRAIEFFERFHRREFDFYGTGWGQSRYKVYQTYKGVIPPDQKIDCLKQYKFCICYENSRYPGYITEKIFDCFQAGCVPVYVGAPNVERYIPKNCFISFTHFKTYKELYRFLISMDEKTYNEYLSNIRAFLNSDQAYLFTLDHYHRTCEKIVEKIDERLEQKLMTAKKREL